MGRHVLVIGGGVIGFASAYYLLQKGFQVTLLENRPRNGANCSTGNAGMIVPSHFIPLAAPGAIGQGIRWMLQPDSPFSIRLRCNPDLIRWAWQFYKASDPKRVERAIPILRDLSLQSRKLFLDLRNKGLDFGLQTRGLLMLCKSAEALAHEKAVAEQARSLGIEAEVLAPKKLAKLDPGVELDVQGGVYFPQDCHLNPAAFLEFLRLEVERLGGLVHYGVAIERFARNGRRIESAHSQEQHWPADEFLLAGGVWTRDLARSLRLSILMQAGKGYSMTLNHPPQLPHICSILVEARVAITPLGGKLRVGGTMEIGATPHRINRRRLSGIQKAVPRYFPRFSVGDFRGTPVWTGLRPCSPDGLPYIGRPRAYDNLTIAAGHGMLGLSLAPVTGRLVAGLIQGDDAPIDLILLHPDRYGY